LLNHPLHFPGILHHKLSIRLRKRPIFWISNNLWHLTHQLFWRWLKQSFNRSCLGISFKFVFLFAKNVKSVNQYLFLYVNQFFINQLFRSKQRQNLLNLRVFRAIFTYTISLILANIPIHFTLSAGQARKLAHTLRAVFF
jgi:hypothetical protein